MEFGNIPACPDELSRIDGDGIPDPVEIGTGEFGGLMNMAMKS